MSALAFALSETTGRKRLSSANHENLTSLFM